MKYLFSDSLLGYFSHIFLFKLNEIGVWFVCRLKASSVPIITRVVKGVAKRYIGCPLNKNVTLRGSIVEVWAKLMLPGKISTVRATLARLNAFIDFLIEGGIVDPSVLARKMRLKVPDSLPRSMDPEDEDRLVSVEGDVRDRAMVLLLLRTRMRTGELLKTKVRDVNMEEQKITIYEGDKNTLGRVVYFSADARDALRAWMRERSLLPYALILNYGTNG